MTRRLLHSTSLLALLLFAATANAALRSPQVPVSGTALQAFFTSQGQAINVNTDQQDLQTVSFAAPQTLEIHAAIVSGPGSTLGLYNAGLAAPALYQVFPGAATNGWYSVASFRTAPTRLVLNLFDDNAAFVGSTSYLAGPPDPADMGLYLLDAGGLTFYSQDARNADGARLLAFSSTGALAGGTWLAWETDAGPGGDFADAIWMLPLPLALAPVPVLHANWGELKARFH